MKESKLTKYTLVAMALLLIAYFSTDARADDNANNIAIMAGSCAEAQVIVGDQLAKKHEFAGNAIMDEAQWWRDFLVEWVDDEEFATRLIGGLMKQIQGSYNSGDLSWDELVNAAQSCTAAKMEIEEAYSE